MNQSHPYIERAITKRLKELFCNFSCLIVTGARQVGKSTLQICFSQMISSPLAIASHPLRGSIFENAVVSELRKQSQLISVPPQMYHWRTYSGAECDLILERDGKFFPIEIKSISNPSKIDARGLIAFRKKHKNLNVQKGLIIAPGENFYPVTNNDYVIPWDII